MFSFFYMKYSPKHDRHILFNLWVNHNMKAKLPFQIVVSRKYHAHFQQTHPHLFPFIQEHSNSSMVRITLYDFIYSYTVGPDDTMHLSYDLPPSFYQEIQQESASLVIGKVFYVPVLHKPIYTTFEIPDFILYRHQDHTNFCVDGIKIHGGENLFSSNIVCMSMKRSPVANDKEFYESTLMHRQYQPGPVVFKNHFVIKHVNLLVDKERKYALQWYTKCGCTTIINIFCDIHHIHIDDVFRRRCLSLDHQKYRYNGYLQNIQYIGFVRNPYHRFLSCYIDKHVLQTDPNYLSSKEYKSYLTKYQTDTLFHLCDFLQKGGYMTMHTVSIQNTNRHFFKHHKQPFAPKSMYLIEEALNQPLYDFLKEYHPELEWRTVENTKENSISNKGVVLLPSLPETPERQSVSISFEHYTVEQWKQYLQTHSIDYEELLAKDGSLQEKIYQLFQEDFIRYGGRTKNI